MPITAVRVTSQHRQVESDESEEEQPLSSVVPSDNVTAHYEQKWGKAEERSRFMPRFKSFDIEKASERKSTGTSKAHPTVAMLRQQALNLPTVSSMEREKALKRQEHSWKKLA